MKVVQGVKGKNSTNIKEFQESFRSKLGTENSFFSLPVLLNQIGDDKTKLTPSPRKTTVQDAGSHLNFSSQRTKIMGFSERHVSVNNPISGGVDEKERSDGNYKSHFRGNLRLKYVGSKTFKRGIVSHETGRKETFRTTTGSDALRINFPSASVGKRRYVDNLKN